KQLRLAADIPPDLHVQTDPALLRHVVGNLLGNAVEYSTAGGWVQVRAAGHDGHFDLSVANATDTLPTEDLPHVTVRFWRKDAAPADAGHSGLGLRVAQTVAAALGLTLTVEMPARDTLRVSLHRAPAPSGTGR